MFLYECDNYKDVYSSVSSATVIAYVMTGLFALLLSADSYFSFVALRACIKVVNKNTAVIEDRHSS
jgi:archaellum biogenesis protein FlaJ (TadC family)